MVRLAHAFVFTSDIDRMAAFYAGAFEMRREDSTDAAFVMMRSADGADVALHQLPAEVANSITVDSPPRWRDDTAYKLCFETDDLDATRKAILDHGGQAKDPWSWEGTEFCECTDPEGNVIQILQRRQAP